MYTMFLSGSVLVSCSHFGAHVMGSDIDYILLHGRGYFNVSYSVQIVRCYTVSSGL